MKTEKKYINKNKIILTDLIGARVYLGTNKSSFYPVSRLFLTGVRNKISIFNLASTIDELKRFFTFTFRIRAFKGRILFVGSPIYKREQFIDLCLKKNHFYVDEEFWIDGLLTNNAQILKHKLRSFTDYENNGEKDHSLLKEKLKGVLKMYTKPDLVIIFNHVYNVEIINEASRLKIPTILFGNSNINFKKITYLVPGNFHSKKANKIYYKLIKHVLNQNFF
jgi:ribosomal protein S2